ncbi:Ubiquitin-associated domain [Sesbania bispinosa]|nr:Ubiquitin-associated domain [Sesbania bispinosa]
MAAALFALLGLLLTKQRFQFSTIVEMRFSRFRAEEALRQVGSNNVELAMEWLFSNPVETQEDVQLARALAMSHVGCSVSCS